MAEMGYCYGSEYHLLRMLGHHRKKLNKDIQEVIKIKGDLDWFDSL